MSSEQWAFDEVKRLQTAIRKHRDQKGDDRCWMDDHELYAVLPEGHVPVEFCDPEVMLENCKRYIAKRHDKDQPYISPQREIDRLNDVLKLLEPGTPEAIINAMFDYSEELGQSPFSPKHALTFIQEIIRSQKDTMKEAEEFILRAVPEHLQGCSFVRTPLPRDRKCNCGRTEIIDRLRRR